MTDKQQFTLPNHSCWKIRCLLSRFLLLLRQKKGIHLQKGWITIQRCFSLWWECVQRISPEQNNCFYTSRFKQFKLARTREPCGAPEAARRAAWLGNRSSVLTGCQDRIIWTTGITGVQWTNYSTWYHQPTENPCLTRSRNQSGRTRKKPNTRVKRLLSSPLATHTILVVGQAVSLPLHSRAETDRVQGQTLKCLLALEKAGMEIIKKKRLFSLRKRRTRQDTLECAVRGRK